MNDKPTCGLLYLSALRKYAVHSDIEIGRERQRLFAAGFVSGQAEKVYLGACKAAMFRPSEETFESIVTILRDVCQRYGLIFQEIDGELWLSRPENAKTVLEDVRRFEPKSEWSHRVRGKLCGIPEAELDLKFHERQGYMEKCDKIT
jgi:hypothetical protein